MTAAKATPANLRGFVAAGREHRLQFGCEDGAACVLACVCGVEAHGATWEDAGRVRDRHLREAAKV